MGTFDLFGRGLVAVLGQSKDSVVVLTLFGVSLCISSQFGDSCLPVLCISLQHQGIFRLADLAGIVIFDLFDILLGLNTFIFRESAPMTLL